MDRDRMITDLVSAGALEIDFETGEIFSTRIRGMNGQRVRLNGANVRGYINHNISYKGKKCATRAHHIVWVAANGAIPQGLMIDHINRQRDDNRLSNLRLVDAVGNAQNKEPNKGENNPLSKVTWEDVKEIRKGHSTGESIRHIADDFPIGKSQVHNVVTGKSWADCDAKLDGTRLMQHRWVVRPNEPQYEDEPPRLCGRLPDRRARIKALGNAVVPQVAYPIFKLLAEYLSETR